MTPPCQPSRFRGFGATAVWLLVFVALPGAARAEVAAASSGIAPFAAPLPAPRTPESGHRSGDDHDAPATDLGTIARILERRLSDAAESGIVVFSRSGDEGELEGAKASAPVAPGGDGGGQRLSAGLAPAQPGVAQRPEAHPRVDREAPANLESRAREATGSILRLDAPQAITATLPEPPPNRGDPLAAACIPDTHLALPSIGREAAFEAIISARTAMIGEFDRPDPTKVKDLAGVYLALGLGVEVEELVREFLPSTESLQPTLTLAMLVEGGVPPGLGAFAPEGCGGAHALWRSYARAASGDATAALAELSDDAAASLETLAPVLRRRLAATLALAALDAGDVARARWLRAMVQRGVDEADTADAADLALLDARLDLLDGRKGEAVARLSAVAGDATPWRREATRLLADQALFLPAGNADLADRVLDLLGGQALMLRGTGEGTRSLLAEARLRTALDGPAAGLSLLDHAQERGLVDETSYRAGVEAVALARLPDPGAPALALLFDAGPERFEAFLPRDGFRRALALSYAAIGAPRLSDAILRDEDRQDASFMAGLAARSAPFAEPAAAGGALEERPVIEQRGSPAIEARGNPGFATGPPPPTAGPDPGSSGPPMRPADGPERPGDPSSVRGRRAAEALARAGEEIEALKRILGDG